MAIFDVRTDIVDPTSRVVFADKINDGTVVAHFIEPFPSRAHSVSLQDGSSEKVIVVSKQHALDLITAIEKTIELGWLK